jgi:hypothetical protein
VAATPLALITATIHAQLASINCEQFVCRPPGRGVKSRHRSRTDARSE